MREKAERERCKHKTHKGKSRMSKFFQQLRDSWTHPPFGLEKLTGKQNNNDNWGEKNLFFIEILHCTQYCSSPSKVRVNVAVCRHFHQQGEQHTSLTMKGPAADVKFNCFLSQERCNMNVFTEDLKLSKEQRFDGKQIGVK